MTRQAHNITLEAKAKIRKKTLDNLGNDFEKTANGFVDYLLLDKQGFPIAVLEAKSEKYDPLIGKEQARRYAQSQNVRFVILSNGNPALLLGPPAGQPNSDHGVSNPESIRATTLSIRILMIWLLRWLKKTISH